MKNIQISGSEARLAGEAVASVLLQDVIGRMEISRPHICWALYWPISGAGARQGPQIAAVG